MHEILIYFLLILILFSIFFTVNITLLLIEFIKKTHFFKIAIFDLIGLFFFGIFTFLNNYLILSQSNLEVSSFLLIINLFILLIIIILFCSMRWMLFKDLIKHKMEKKW